MLAEHAATAGMVAMSTARLGAVSLSMKAIALASG
jgi:hypothetical protein